MMKTRHDPVSKYEPLAVGLLLAVAAILAPVPLYLLAIVLLGLPHVLWEMNWVKRIYGASIPSVWWLAMGCVLLLQVFARLGNWAALVPSEISVVLDLMTLAVLALMTAGLVQHLGGRHARRSVLLALATGIGLILAVAAGNVVGVLVFLAIAHNFTPWLLTPHNLRVAQQPARRPLSLLFLLPWLVALLLWFAPTLAPSLDLSGKPWLPGEAAWFQLHLPETFRAALSAMVLAQCLHYYAVLRLWPAMLPSQGFRQWQKWAVLLTVLLLGYFLMNFSSARRLYAVASGVHAWLELPLILLLLSGIQPVSPDVLIEERF